VGVHISLQEDRENYWELLERKLKAKEELNLSSTKGCGVFVK
jgi:hypothetical protein